MLIGVHPHGRGDQAAPASARGANSGPSPRAWGSADPQIRPHLGARSIPTGVGRVIGLSPRAWGAALRRAQPGVGRRFIPTGMGSSRSRPRQARPRSVHPHGRGEHPLQVGGVALVLRSIPTGVGNVFPPPRLQAGPRSIPTGVGSIYIVLWIAMLPTAHPHRRDDQMILPVAWIRIVGPSPRAWGPVERIMLDVDHNRFSPTHVGNSSPPANRPPCRSVHPHRRGEHLVQSHPSDPPRSSSPRSWGPDEDRANHDQALRFIPTGVGSTSRPGRCAVHPHGRGEQRVRLTISSGSSGPSPRAWGAVAGRDGSQGAGGFIPTHVGTRPRHRLQLPSCVVHPH